MKKLFALFLAAALLLSAALAADVSELFPTVRAPKVFPDVQESWYINEVAICYEAGLLSGTETGNFNPGGTVTLAQAATIAARMHDILNGGTGVLETTDPWYASAVTYVETLGIQGLDDPEALSTRHDFFVLLSVALYGQTLTPLNSIAALPDTTDANVLYFYNAGILTGVDEYGTFNGNGTLTRAEMAVMAARVVRPGLRKVFDPKELPNPQAPTPAYGTGYGSFGGVEITGEQIVEALEQAYAYYEIVDWSYDYGMDVAAFFREQALRTAAENMLLIETANVYGLPAATAYEAYMSIHDVYAANALRAKHILFRTVDDNNLPLSAEEQAGALARAQLMLEQLQYSPTEEMFDSIMNSQSEDGGLASYPNGYVFGPGGVQMVTEFEEATAALAIGGISGIVQSQYGYHIILRLDPEADAEGYAAHLDDIHEYLGEWLEATIANGVLTSGAALDAFDVEAHYMAWLATQQ